MQGKMKLSGETGALPLAKYQQRMALRLQLQSHDNQYRIGGGPSPKRSEKSYNENQKESDEIIRRI